MRLAFLGRPLKPLIIAIAMSMATLAWFNLVLNAGVFHASVLGDLIGSAAGASCALLFGGWWWRSGEMERFGLLLAVGVWVTRTMFAGFTEGFMQVEVWLSACWVFAVASTYYMEATHSSLSERAR